MNQSVACSRGFRVVKSRWWLLEHKKKTKTRREFLEDSQVGKTFTNKWKVSSNESSKGAAKSLRHPLITFTRCKPRSICSELLINLEYFH